MLHAETRGPPAERLDLPKWVRIWHGLAVSRNKIAVSGHKVTPDVTFRPETAIIHKGLTKDCSTQRE